MTYHIEEKLYTSEKFHPTAINFVANCVATVAIFLVLVMEESVRTLAMKTYFPASFSNLLATQNEDI
jgi:hypothetical protein